MRRNILERASKIYPFLRFDQDPYIVVHNGRLVWIMDGYTSTDMIPYSERLSGPTGSLNYIRNSVKLTCDAYTGEVIAYAVEPNEPILRAYRQIYPGLVRDLSELPAGLQEHFRYPEDLFQIQSQELTNYHVTDPTVFLTNSDAWSIARERNLYGEKAPIRPYYVQLQLKNEPKPQFQLILPFTPNQKPNMSGWLSAQCDPGVYGQMKLYRFKGPLPKGPELMEADFSSTPAISYINRQYRNDQSDVIVGNLLVIPIGKSVMYSESLLLQSKTIGIQSVPRLFRVILALNDKVVVGETYADALKQLFQGTESPPLAQAEPSQTTTNPQAVASPPVTSSTVASVKAALELYDQANAALKNGDFAKYGELQKKLRGRRGLVCGRGTREGFRRQNASINAIIDAMTVGIVGLGLIGGSIGLALREPGRTILGFDVDPGSAQTAKERFCIDKDVPLDEVAKADVVFVAVPPKYVVATLEVLAIKRGPTTVITDCTSVKSEVFEWARTRKEANFVIGHPMAGHEKSGAAFASAWMFRGARWILCPTKGTAASAVRAIEALVKAMGAMPVRMSPEHHDRQVAVLSHLPHALAGVLVQIREDLGDEDVSGGSWKDLTRVAGVDPNLWTQIFMANRLEIAKAIQETQRGLSRASRQPRSQ